MAPSKLTGYDIRPDHQRTDYAHLSRLPTDPAGMREHLYRGLAQDPLADYKAWGNVGSMITRAYMPAAQRAALFRAAGTIPGVETVNEAEDAAGRRGIAVAMVNKFGGVRPSTSSTPPPTCTWASASSWWTRPRRERPRAPC